MPGGIGISIAGGAETQPEGLSVLPRLSVRRAQLPCRADKIQHGVLGTAVPIGAPTTPITPSYLLASTPPEGAGARAKWPAHFVDLPKFRALDLAAPVAAGPHSCHGLPRKWGDQRAEPTTLKCGAHTPDFHG